MIVPVHRDGNHWGLAVLDIKCSVVRYFDSLGYTQPATLRSRLVEYLEGESKTSGKRLKPGPWPLVHGSAAPAHCYFRGSKQRNMSDCGVFMCTHAARFAAGITLNFNTEPSAMEAL